MTRRAHFSGLLAFGSLALIGTACAKSAETVTYHGAVEAILERRCNGCHVEGGIAQFALTDYASAKTWAPAIVTSVQARRMPPWLPDPDCRRFRHERLMPEDEIRALTLWLEGGAVEGDPAERAARAPAPPLEEAPSLEALGPPSAVARSAAAYTPDPSRPDDYRCFPLALDSTEDQYLAAAQVIPGRAELVHHVIVFLVPREFAARLDAREAEEEGPGYTCFGGPGVGLPTPVAGWVPGSVPQISSPEARIRIPAGSRLVMQVHYNTLSTTPAPDHTAVELWLTREAPVDLLVPRFFPHLGLRIEAGDGASRQERVFRNTSDRPWTIVATSPHMHLLGTKMTMHAVHADGRESCIVDVPRWDFGWQQSYSMRPGEEVRVEPGEALRLVCTYDNSPSNQPVVSGERLEPREVTWGEGTLDEMCLNTLVLREPFAPEPDRTLACQGFQACYDDCEAAGRLPRTGCILRCGQSGCAQCVLGGVVSCTLEGCARQTDALLQCLEACQVGGASETCVSERCGLTILGFDRCVDPYIERGQCEASVGGCGVHL